MHFNPVSLLLLSKIKTTTKTAQNIPKLQMYYPHTGDLIAKFYDIFNGTWLLYEKKFYWEGTLALGDV